MKNQTPCPICRHLERSTIDHAISEGRSDTYLAKHFAIPAGSLRRHRDQCLRPAPAPGQPPPQPAAAAGAPSDLERIHRLRERALEIATQACADDKHWRTALAAMTAFSRLASEAARLSAPPPAARGGKSAPQEAGPVKLAETEEWQDLKRRILRVLDRYPGAREALAQELSDAA